MKKIWIRPWILIGLLSLSLMSCKDEVETNESKITSSIIREDFMHRFKDAEVQTYWEYTENDTAQYIKFTTPDIQSGTAVYRHNRWNVTVIRLTMSQLPAIRFKFTKDISEEKPKEILYVNRAEIPPYYVFKYMVPEKGKPNTYKIWEIIFDDKGNEIHRMNSSSMDQEYMSQTAEQVSFISQKYPNTEILCRYNNSSYDVYIIKDQGKLKKVAFEWKNGVRKWAATYTDEPADYAFPENIKNYIRNQFPDFPYTKVTVIETAEGYVYSIVNENDPNDKGYLFSLDSNQGDIPNNWKVTIIQ